MLRGASVVVRRGDEVLVLHSAEYHDNGDWEWVPPGGVREPGETASENAARELREETGLELPLTPAREGEWALFVAEAPSDVEVVLSDEHDGYDWVATDEARARCRPALVAECFR